MKKIQFTLATVLFISLSACVSKKLYKGKINAANATSAKIEINGKATNTKVDADGNFNLMANPNDTLLVTLEGYTGNITLPTNTPSNKSLESTAGGPENHLLSASAPSLAVSAPTSGSSLSSSSSISPQSYWVGASVGSNVNKPSGNSGNNIVGGAGVSINTLKSTPLGATWAIVGNLGNFNSSTDTKDLSTNLSKLSQANSGLNVGIAATWALNDTTQSKHAFRAFGITSYQLNTFSNVGADSSTVSLNQWKTSAGLEFEQQDFNNGGALHAGLAAGIGVFDPTAYKKVFGTSKSNILSLDATIVLPLSTQFGFLLEGTYSQYATPTYLIGVIIRTSGGSGSKAKTSGNQ